MRNSINPHQDPFHNHWNSLMPFPFHWVSACRLVSLQAGIHINFVMGLNRLPKTGSALCSPGPMFPGSYIPRSYIPRYLCSPVLSSPVPIFPGSYVPPNLTSPMFPGSYVPQYLCSPRNNITHPMFPGPYAPRVLCSPWAIDIISLPLKV